MTVDNIVHSGNGQVCQLRFDDSLISDSITTLYHKGLNVWGYGSFVRAAAPTRVRVLAYTIPFDPEAIPLGVSNWVKPQAVDSVRWSMAINAIRKGSIQMKGEFVLILEVEVQEGMQCEDLLPITAEVDYW
ncbi:MAG: hypothetical protein AB7H80_13490 [Candidatus Kapaibacterium sp.]